MEMPAGGGATKPPPSRDPSPVGPPLRHDVSSHVATVRALSQAQGRSGGPAASPSGANGGADDARGTSGSNGVQRRAPAQQHTWAKQLGVATAAFIDGAGDGGDPAELFQKRLRGLQEAVRVNPSYSTYGQLANFIADIFPDERREEAKQSYENCLLAWRTDRDRQRRAQAKAGLTRSVSERGADTAPKGNGRLQAAGPASGDNVRDDDFASSMYISLYAEFKKTVERDFPGASWYIKHA